MEFYPFTCFLSQPLKSTFMKKITTMLFSILCMLNIANAQDITVFNFDGVTPTTGSWADSFVSNNPLFDGCDYSK